MPNTQLPNIINALLRWITRAPGGITWLFLFMVSGLTAGFGATGGSFEVTGFISSKFYKNGALTHSRTNSFRATVVECNVLIRTEQSGAESEYWEYGSDGTFSWVMIKHSDKEISQRVAIDFKTGQFITNQLQNPRKALNDSSLFLRPSLVPIPLTGLISPVWAAYGSKCYLTSRNTNLVEPMFTVEKTTQTRRNPYLPAEWSMDDSDPKLVKEIKLLANGPASGISFQNDRLVIDSTYEALSWTNVDGLHIPVAFRAVKKIFESQGANETQTEKSLVMEGRATEVLPDPKREMTGQPLVTQRTRIVDSRFEQETGSPNPIVYISKQAKILSLNELKQMPELEKTFFRKYRAHAASERNIPLLLVYIGLGICGLLAVLIIVRFGWRWTIRKQ